VLHGNRPHLGFKACSQNPYKRFHAFLTNRPARVMVYIMHYQPNHRRLMPI
jgi:hypothetical protein